MNLADCQIMNCIIKNVNNSYISKSSLSEEYGIYTIY